MRLVVGLGNPGARYERTRHNVGFRVIDELGHRFGVQTWRGWMNSQTARVQIGGTSVLLAKPLTFMNLSGDAVQPMLRYYRLEPEHLLVIYDDLDLPPGALRVRPEGGAGGHRGMRSIITQLGTDRFARVRIGIGRPTPPMTAAEYVLAAFAPAEADTVDEAVRTAADAVDTWLREGTDAAMNKYNQAMP